MIKESNIMKRFYLIMAVALMTAAGCNKEMPKDVQVNGKVILSAGVETDTKVGAAIDAASKKVAFSWTTADVVSVHTTAGFENFTLVGTGGEATGSFSGSPVGTVGEIALFPSTLSPVLEGESLTLTLPAEYTASAGQTNALMLADVVDGYMQFYHLGALLKINYSNVAAATKLVVSVPGKKINGEYVIDLNQETPYLVLQDTAVESESKVVVNVAPSGSSLTAYVPLPVGEYQQMSVWLENIAGEMIPGSLKNTTETKTFSRKTVKDMPSIHVYSSYVLNSLAEVEAFNAGPKEIIQNLTVNDPGCTIPDTPISNLKLRVEKVLGDLTIIGTQMTTTEIIFGETGVTWGVFQPEGNIVFKDCPNLFNLNGFRTWTVIHGDIVFDNCPLLSTNWGPGNCLSQVTEVKGSIKLINIPTQMAGVTFNSLQKVGGDIYVENCNGMFWNFGPSMPLEDIGGSLTIINNLNFNGLGGFENIKHIGGTVTLSGNGAGAGGILNPGTTAQPGFELVQSWIDRGIVSKDEVSCADHNGTPIAFN